MKQKFRIKPSKPMGVVQMIGGIVFALVGFAVIIPMMSKNNGPVWFGLLWTCGAVVIGIIGAINAFSDTGVPTEEIVSDSVDPQIHKSTEDRLRELTELHKQELISEDEYVRARKRILDEH